MANDKPLSPNTAPAGSVDAFLKALAAAPARRSDGRGRLIFAMDATASREPSWAQAQRIQAAMFQETAALGGLSVQLAYYRGFAEFSASEWASDAERLLAFMREVTCLGGQTQIAKVLRHTLAETRRLRVAALVFVGDCMEEDADELCARAGELGLLGVPAFLFHEGDDTVAARAFAQMAKLSGGACCRFDASSPRQLRDLLAAVAVYAAGGRQALVDYGRRQGGLVLRLTHQMGGKGG